MSPTTELPQVKGGGRNRRELLGSCSVAAVAEEGLVANHKPMIANRNHDAAPVGIAKYATLPHWLAISGMGRTKAYEELGRGNLRAVKLGKRILVDVDHGLAWLAGLPAATIRAPKKSNTI